jgi:hypothetical protein
VHRWHALTLVVPRRQCSWHVSALFVALVGVGYAAATIDSGNIVNNSVRSKDVKKRALRGWDLRKNTLGGAE